MNKSCVAAVLMLTGLLGVGRSAHAQDADAVVVSVPFEFVAGGATLPAGKYRVNHVSAGVSQELAISSYTNGGTFLLPLSFDDTPAGQPTLSFEHVGGKYFLIGIKTTSGVYSMAASREMVMLGKANSSSTSSASGSH